MIEPDKRDQVVKTGRLFAASEGFGRILES
jgi:hypothetical protein